MTPPTPFVLTIFGGSGDLAKIKLFPALYELAHHRRFPERCSIVGYARTAKTSDEFRREFEAAIRAAVPAGELDEAALVGLLPHVHYVTGQYDAPADYDRLTATRTTLPGSEGTQLVYLAIPPVVTPIVIERLAASRAGGGEDLRLILEKPFGHDEATARDLLRLLDVRFRPDQLFLLDHYLGKSGVQSILSLRRSNRVVNLLLRGSEIASIQLTVAESLGVTHRIGYFDQVGTIRDMVQSHLFQILALLTMALPVDDSPASLHREKVGVLSALSFSGAAGSIVTGQYAGYRHEHPDIAASQTETYVALRLGIDREDWFGVPLYLRTGKKLGRARRTAVTVEFKRLVGQDPADQPNRLVLELQPEERLSLRLLRHQAEGLETQMTAADTSIACVGDLCLPEHAQLLLDVLRGDHAHFLSAEEILASWRLTDRILAHLREQGVQPVTYADGSMGPVEADAVFGAEGGAWV